MDLTGAGHIEFYRSLGTSARAGVALTKTLEVLAKGNSAIDGETMRRLQRRVELGQTLSSAMKEHPDVFPAWQAEIVGVGEATGRLDASLVDLAQALEERRAFLLKFLSGIAYPFLLANVAPFLLYGAKLVVEGLGPYLAAVGGVLLKIYVPLGLLVFVLHQGLIPRRFIPVAGPLLSKLQFCTFLSAMLRAAVPPRRALELSASAAGVAPAATEARDGETLLESIKRYGVFSDEELARIEVAELSGKLDEDLQAIALQLSQRYQAILKTASSVLPVVVYLGVALVIGLKVVEGTMGDINQTIQQAEEVSK